MAQAAVPALLDATHNPNNPHHAEMQAWKIRLRRQLQQQADTLTCRLRDIPGLHCSDAQGAFYLMVKLTDQDNDDDDVEFCQRLLREHNVFLLPGRCFGAPHWVRIVFCAPLDVIHEAADRIQQCCTRNKDKQE